MIRSNLEHVIVIEKGQILLLFPELERRENINSNLDITGDVTGLYKDLTTAC